MGHVKGHTGRQTTSAEGPHFQSFAVISCRSDVFVGKGVGSKMVRIRRRHARHSFSVLLSFLLVVSFHPALPGDRARVCVCVCVVCVWLCWGLNMGHETFW